MARLGPSKHTRAEREFRMLLVRSGVPHELHPPIPGFPRRSADFLVKGVYVFIHGRFWHDPGHRTRSMSSYWREKVRRNSERDAETLASLDAAGLRYMVLWDDQFRASRMAEVTEAMYWAFGIRAAEGPGQLPAAS